MQHSLLAILIAGAVIACTYAETDCEGHRRTEANGSRHGLKWIIECDENGHYKPLQCNDEAVESKKWCACYNKEGIITRPSRKTRTCVCPLRADEAKRNGASEHDCRIPKCENTGKWAKKQCCGSPETCYCVNPENGEKTTQPTTDRNLECP